MSGDALRDALDVLEARKSTPKGQQIPQTVESLQAIMARDAVLVQEQEATIGALRAKNNQLQQKLASRLKQIAQLQARLESEEAHYTRLYCKNQEVHAAALALANVCRSEWDEFADIETVEVVIEYELVENLLNALR